MDDQLALFELPPVSKTYTHVFKGLERPIWTENKEKMIAVSLSLVVYITNHGAYIDGFAGPQEPDMPDMWTAKLVLESEPKRWSHFLTQPAKVDSPIQRTIHHEDAETVFG